jgi:hypothetical protein
VYNCSDFEWGMQAFCDRKYKTIIHHHQKNLSFTKKSELKNSIIQMSNQDIKEKQKKMTIRLKIIIQRRRILYIMFLLSLFTLFG